MNTKDKILFAALELFSAYGYSDVSMESLAKEVGIKAPSIYKHYKSKQEIFFSILERGKDIIYSALNKLAEEVKEDEHCLKLQDFGLWIFKYFLHDDYISKLRKILSLEFYKQPLLMEMYIEQYIREPLIQHQELIEYFGLGKEDVETLAFAFYAQIFLALKIADAAPNKEEEMINVLRNIYAKLFEVLRQKIN